MDTDELKKQLEMSKSIPEILKIHIDLLENTPLEKLEHPAVKMWLRLLDLYRELTCCLAWQGTAFFEVRRFLEIIEESKSLFQRLRQETGGPDTGVDLEQKIVKLQGLLERHKPQ